MDIVIVTYNSEKWIKRCLDSLLKAKALSSDLKLFFVDNHSSDQTVELLTAYEKKDDFSRFEIIQQEQNQGFGNHWKTSYCGTDHRSFPSCQRTEL